MKTKLSIIGCFIILLIICNACTKEAIEACTSGDAYSCLPPIPEENSILDNVQKTRDSTLAVSKLPDLE